MRIEGRDVAQQADGLQDVPCHGLETLSWKLPCEPAKPTVASLPKTWVATIVMASHWVRLTLPGMMDEPGSFSGMINADAVTGPTRSAHVVRDLHEGVGQDAQRAETNAARRAPGAANGLSACLNSMPRLLGDLLRSELAELRVSVQAGAHGGAPMASSRARVRVLNAVEGEVV